MEKTKLTAGELRSNLANFTGTETWWRHGLVRSVTYTDGVKYFADKAGAYWLLDIFSTELAGLVRKNEFLALAAKVAKGKAVLEATDGNEKVLWSKKIGFTDCPEGEWKFFMALGGPEGSAVILLPSEY